MHIVVTHDRDGNIVSLTICPPDGPPVAGVVDVGQYVTELDVPEDALDFIRQEGENDEERIIKALAEFRVDLKTEGKLVRKSAST
jgi:hypothetical protein